MRRPCRGPNPGGPWPRWRFATSGAVDHCRLLAYRDVPPSEGGRPGSKPGGVKHTPTWTPTDTPSPSPRHVHSHRHAHPHTHATPTSTPTPPRLELRPDAHPTPTPPTHTPTPTPLRPTPDGVLRQARVPILMYHHIDGAPPAQMLCAVTYRSAREFEAQLRYLQRRATRPSL